MKLRKIIAMLCITVLAAGCFGVLSGCGPNNEEVIRESLTKQFDAYKNKDESILTETNENLSGMQLEQLGIDVEELTLAVLDGMDYTIDDVEVNGDTATAHVTIISKSYSAFEDAMNQILNSIEDDPNIAGMTQQEAQEYVGQKMMEALNNIEPTAQEATIEYKKEGNMWQPVRGTHSLAHIDSLVFAE